jgi:hypothetical protein
MSVCLRLKGVGVYGLFPEVYRQNTAQLRLNYGFDTALIRLNYGFGMLGPWDIYA